MDKVYINRLPDDKDNSSRNTTNKDIATNQNNSTTKYTMSIEKNHLDSLDPKFKNSIEEFIRVLNGHLDDAQVSKDQKKLLEKQIEGLALEIKNIPSYKKIEDNPKTDFTQSINKNKDGDIECCDRVLEINPQNADAYYNKAQALSTIEKYAEAIEYYDKALEINPQNADICYNNKGLSLYYLGNNDEAIECYDKALEINPQFSCAYYNKGIIFSANGYNNEAIECYDKALEINPQNADAYNNKGLSLYYLGNNDEAIECYDKALEINPQFSWAYNNKGLSLYYLGNNDEAIECYDKALEINPQNADAYYNKAQALSTIEKYAEAIEYYDKALEINPQNADAYYNKAQALSTIEKYAEAIEYYDKALELESDNVNALNKKAWYLVNHFPKRLNEASETIKKAIGLDPTNNNIMYTYGYTLDKLKTYEEAILVYEHIIKQKPSFSNVWYDCARSKIKLDDKDIQSCIYNLQKAIELNPDYKEKAKHEIDFQDIRNYSEFKKILESNPNF